MNRKTACIVLFGLTAILFANCGQKSVPKPYGYFRVDLPAPDYRRIDARSLPYTFELNKIAVIIRQEKEGEKYWIDINYPRLNANIHCSYKDIKGNLYELSEESRTMVYRHSVRADGIGEQAYENPPKQVYGMLYELQGNTASSAQFILTDSVKHFFRGALYFNNVPNSDSIAPVLDYIKKDIRYLIESFEWTK
ncbi:MAG: gliding motility lipoprotein GldD [Prevotellaceae bacterium]|nr:gliding motility lipoprotein GldD [Prevotellaceae bacterium]